MPRRMAFGEKPYDLRLQRAHSIRSNMSTTLDLVRHGETHRWADPWDFLAQQTRAAPQALVRGCVDLEVRGLTRQEVPAFADARKVVEVLQG